MLLLQGFASRWRLPDQILDHTLNVIWSPIIYSRKLESYVTRVEECGLASG